MEKRRVNEEMEYQLLQRCFWLSILYEYNKNLQKNGRGTTRSQEKDGWDGERPKKSWAIIRNNPLLVYLEAELQWKVQQLRYNNQVSTIF